jgi:hypothetical protein
LNALRSLQLQLALIELQILLRLTISELLEAMEKSSEAFISNAVISGKYALRFCIVNFRASTGDIEAMPPLVARLGRRIHAEIRSSTARISESVPEKG